MAPAIASRGRRRIATGLRACKPTIITSSQVFNESTQGSRVAFDEIFRCLLGTGVEVMIARAIVRMTCHTTLKQRIVLSCSTWSMLQIMSDTAWRPTDVARVNSTFPNCETIKSNEDKERLSDLLQNWESTNIDRG